MFGFVNNFNILIYSKTIEKDCKALERAHKIYIAWVRRYKVMFTPKKYYFIYFIKSYKKFNIKVIVNIRRFMKGLVSNLRVLRV